MKLVTRDTDYAVRALCFIAKGKKKVVAVSDLVKELKIPKPFLRKILQILSKRKILKSYKGQGGGFELMRLPEKIFFLDLIKIFQGPLKINGCVFKKRICSNIKTCTLKKRIDAIEKYVISELKNITISTLL